MYYDTYIFTSFMSLLLLYIFFFNDTATTEIYTLSLHDALPIFRSSSRRFLDQVGQTIGGVRPAERPAPFGHRLEALLVIDHPFDPLSQGLRGELVVEQDARPPRPPHRPCVRLLMTPGGVRIWDQQGGEPHGRDLRDGGGSCPRHHEVCARVGQVHPFEEAEGANHQPSGRGRKGPADGLEVGLAGDQEDLEVAAARQDAAGTGRGPVDVEGPLAPPEHQDAAPPIRQVELLPPLLRQRFPA